MLPTVDENSCIISKSIVESLRTLPAGDTFSVHVIQTSDHQVDSLTPRRHFSHFHSETTTSRRILALVSQDGVLVAGLEVHEFTSISVEVNNGHRLTPSVAVNVCIEKLDSSGYLAHRTPLARMLVAGYLCSLTRYNAAIGIPTVGVHLFARAQPEYLFAKSQSNPGKHILDDLGLVKWWQSTIQHSVSYAARTIQCTADSATVNCTAPGSTASESSWFIGSKGNAIDISEPCTVDNTVNNTSRPDVDFTDAKFIKWVWGLPYPEAARAHDCVLQFPDDPMTRLLSESHSSTWSVAMLLEMLAVSEECGSGRRTAYFTVSLPVSTQANSATTEGDVVATAEQGMLSFDEYDQILVELFGHNMDFSSRDGAFASSKLFLDFVRDSFDINPTTVVCSGAPIVKDAASYVKQHDTPKVNDLTMVIRKKRKVQE